MVPVEVEMCIRAANGVDSQDAGKVDCCQDEVENVIISSCPDVDHIGKAGVCGCGILDEFIPTAFVGEAVRVQLNRHLGIKMIMT